MARKFVFAFSALVILVLLSPAQVLAANEININSPTWLGPLKLSKSQLKDIRKAVGEALDSPIDAEHQCGKERLDCVVRAAREWEVGGDKYREIVIHLHTVGHSAHAIGQNKGKWPAIVAK